MKYYLINKALFALYRVNDAADTAQDWLFRLERSLVAKEAEKEKK